LDKLTDGPDTGNFGCQDNIDCQFWLTTTGVDEECSKGAFGYTSINHSWGSGDYLLVSLAKTDKGTYKSGDLQDGSTCP